MDEKIKKIALAFDAESVFYDEKFNKHPSGKAMRRRTHQVYSEFLLKGNHVLDINCGTGEDFHYFQKNEIRITGLDCSEKMLALAGARFPNAELHQMDYNHLSLLEGRFDVICSNFGGLNTQSQFHEFSKSCHEKLGNGGFLLLNIMTKWPLMEIIEGLVWGRHFFRRVRAKKTLTLRVGNQRIPTYYFNPKTFYKTFFKNQFHLLKMVGLGVFLPPTYVDMKGLPGFHGLEECCSHMFPFNRLGDHTMLVMKAK